MAESLVILAIEKLSSVVSSQVSLLRGVHRQLEYIKDELNAMRSFLRDADMKLARTGEEEEEEEEEVVGDRSLREWVKQVRKLTFCFEDVVDDWAYYEAHWRGGGGNGNGGGSFIRRTFSSIRRMKERRHIASKIQNIKKALIEAKERRVYYSTLFGMRGGGPSSSSGSGSANFGNHDPRRMASLFVAEAELVGIQHSREDMVSRLVDGEVVRKNKVISVVGTGGLGKTTLVKKVYEDSRVMDHFDCHAWITVSQSYKKKHLLMDMIKKFLRTTKESMADADAAYAAAAAAAALEGEGEDSLIDSLRWYLKEKRYLVVFDDVWKIDFWDYIQLTLPENDKGSRIMFTTRNEHVVPSPIQSPFHHVFRLQPLPHDTALELFCKKAFQFQGGCCHPNLEELSHLIVERCGGLPLAIVAIGGLLAAKDKSVTEWQKLYDGLSYMLGRDQSLANDQKLSSIARVLSLSYHDLPYHLKICFLYLGMFPEDYFIDCHRLTNLWIAQGFIREIPGRAIEAVAEEYLKELINRNLVQVALLKIQGTVKQCRVHDILREVIILPRLEELGIYLVPRAEDTNFDGVCRHIAIESWTNDASSNIVRQTQSRSLILFGMNEPLGSFLSPFFQNSKLLRALDFRDVPLEFIPNELGNLWHLRYLSLKGTNVKHLPSSVGNLSNLETLDLRFSPVYDLPVEINRLFKLRHLLGFYFDLSNKFRLNSLRGVKMPGAFGHLQALEKLSAIEMDKGPELINELGRLTKLKKLGISKLRTAECSALCAVLEKMTRLVRLWIYSANEDEHIDLESMSVPPPLLEKLYLYGPLGKLPHWIPMLKKLRKFNLSWSKLDNERLLNILQDLPSLQLLGVFQGYNGKRLHFGKGGFGKLKELLLRRLVALEKLVIEDGALPLLEMLELGPYPLLQEMPDFHILKNLKSLQLWDLQKNFIRDLLPDGGSEYWKIKHVANVVFHFTYPDRFYYNTYKLSDPGLLKHLDRLSSSSS